MKTIKYNSIKPIHDGVLVTDMDFDMVTTQSGIIIQSDDGKSEGIKPRWCKVFAVGKDQHTVKTGDWILVEHGRWTRAINVEDNTGNVYEVRRVETKSIVMITDEKPTDVYFGKSNKSPYQTFDFSKPL